MKLRNLRPGIVLGALAALWAAGVVLACLWAFTIAAPNIWRDANRRTAIASDVVLLGQRLQLQHASLTQSASQIVNRITAVPQYTAVVVDDSGKVLAGNRQLAEAAPLRRFPPPLVGSPPPGIPPLRDLFETRLANSDNPGTVQSPIRRMISPPSVIRLTGETVIFAPLSDPIEAIQNLARAIVVGLVILAFLCVWLVARRYFISTARPMERVRTALLQLVQSDYAGVEVLAADEGAGAELVDAYNVAAKEMMSTYRQKAEYETNMRQFVADAGHELRTPLTVIMGYVELVRQMVKMEDGMANRIFSEIEGQGKRMTMLIQKLLLLTRIESQDPRDVKVLDAADVAHNIVDSFRPLANGSRFVEETEPGSFVEVSESELRESLRNLLDNALKYAPGTTIVTTVRTEGDSVLIRVRDDGPGMSPELSARAFERFTRGETAGSVGGSGLGLAIVKRSIERGGGSVSLDTKLGEGTTVEIRLPHQAEAA